MPDWVFGIDVSYAQLDDAKCDLLKLAGVNVATQCLWTGGEQPAVRVNNLRLLHNKGIKIAAYASIGNTGAGSWHMQQARNGVPDDLWAALQRCSVDVELPGNTLGQTVQAHDQVVAYGKPRTTYTSYHQWHDVMGNPPHPVSELWNAYWDGDPDVDFPHLRFGGWADEDVIVEQWSGGTKVQGVFADRDQYRADKFGLVAPIPGPVIPQPTPPPSPTDSQWLAASAQADTLALLFATRQRPSAALRETIKYLMG